MKKSLLKFPVSVYPFSNFGDYMCKFFYLLFLIIAVSGCYQIHSDDDLRAVPVTNNPNIVPQSNGMGRFIAMP